MLELKPKPTGNTSGDVSVFENRQPLRLVLALVLLLVAFAGVLYRDREFWFGPREISSLESDAAEPRVAHPPAAKPVPSADTQAAVPAPAVKKQETAAVKPSAEPKPADAAVETKRTVLPPLDVEVVAGDTHRTIRPGTNTTKVEITHAAPGATKAGASQSAPELGVAVNAAGREMIAADSVHSAQSSVDATYPMLARQARVEGSVVLQALIGADGLIQDIRVLSGPAILSSAAREAVRQWRFKPYLQNGQPVETKAKITVNFTIKVSGNSATTS